MSKNKLNMIDLEKEMALVETDAIAEEQYNADKNYAYLDAEYDELTSQLPCPNVGKFDTVTDLADLQALQDAKERNMDIWNQQDEIDKYRNKGNLYVGHLNYHGTDYYFMEKCKLDTKNIAKNVWLIHVDDDNINSEHVHAWRYPSEHNDVNFSRNIAMCNRKVSDVDIVLDKGSELFSNITDTYLRKALIRNKTNGSVQSIIQTIQKKQDNIRSLPKEKTFIVQGCAGSGKTMVLLHRLRYLLHNKYMNNEEYIFLIPSNGFKEFITEISKDFNIHRNNIFPYQQYYQEVLGKKTSTAVTDTSELIFAPKYLERVYSKAFMQEAYKSIFDEFLKQTESLISFCDEKLNILVEKETSVLKESIDNVKKDAVKLAVDTVKDIQNHTSTKIENNFDNIPALIAEIEATYSQRKKEYEIAINPDVEITIAPDDERILSNENLIEIKRTIEAEQLALEKASIFTALSHRNKLKKLQENYEAALEELTKILIEEDKARYASQATQLAFIFGNVTIAETETILKDLKTIMDVADSDINKAQMNLDNITEYFSEKFAAEINALNKLIVVSADIAKLEKDYIENLVPSYSFFEEFILLGVELLKSFNDHVTSDKDKEFIKKELLLFTERSQNKLYAYLNTLLFNICKKKIFKDFEIKISHVYKHYWYLNLYCYYLTRPLKESARKYIFIDEAQDLSASEIELINKVNSITSKPVINLFGDTNQTISTHGVRDWSQLPIISEVHTLEENFRNTNQIVDYCNKNLTVKMEKIGVDMEEVSEYKTIHDAIRNSDSIADGAIFIVKDDYSIEDLKALLTETQISDYEIYTVKAAKGLEFKEIFVFDTDMTHNEKYISYTRALAKLNVIKSLPQTTDRKLSLIIEGNETEENPEAIEDSN